MSTEADGHRDKAVESVKDAIQNLSEIVVNQCCGHDDYGEEYRAALKQSLVDLIEVRDRL